MPSLPVSVRLALWGTRALSGAVPVDTALRLSAPDADHLEGARARLEAWRDLGERALLVALPRPGDLTGLPRGGADFMAAACDAGECVHVPGLGGALVPDVSTYGPAGDEGLAVRWRAFDCDPVPPHVSDSWSLRELERAFAHAMADGVRSLSTTGGPWATRGLRELADERLSASAWGLPDDLPSRAESLLHRAAVVADALSFALEAPDDSPHSASALTRTEAMRRLQAVAEGTLAQAASVAALSLAGLRPGRDD